MQESLCTPAGGVSRLQRLHRTRKVLRPHERWLLRLGDRASKEYRREEFVSRDCCIASVSAPSCWPESRAAPVKHRPCGQARRGKHKRLTATACLQTFETPPGDEIGSSKRGYRWLQTESSAKGFSLKQRQQTNGLSVSGIVSGPTTDRRFIFYGMSAFHPCHAKSFQAVQQ
jgi:hypothetical protein